MNQVNIPHELYKIDDDEWRKKYGYTACAGCCCMEENEFVDIHTHGFMDKFDHPDIQIVMRIPEGAAYLVIHNIAKELAKGVRFQTNRRYNNIIPMDFDIMFTAVQSGDRTLLRVILPDNTNNLMVDPTPLELARGFTKVEGVYAKQWTVKPQESGLSNVLAALMASISSGHES